MDNNDLTNFAGTVVIGAIAYKLADSALNKGSRRKGKRTSKQQKKPSNNLHDIFGF
jgi:hypothetical protein